MFLFLTRKEFYKKLMKCQTFFERKLLKNDKEEKEYYFLILCCLISKFLLPKIFIFISFKYIFI